MAQKTNPTVIGGFVLGAIVLAVAGVFIFGGGKFFTEKEPYVLFVQGSVKGLQVGAPVSFKGVNVGSVTDIKVLYDSKALSFWISIFIQIEPNRFTETQGDPRAEQLYGSQQELMDQLIKKGLRAQLKSQSFVTGLLFVEIDIFPKRPPRLLGLDEEHVEIPTIPSPIEELTKTIDALNLQELANKALETVVGIERLVNSPELKEIIKGINELSKQANTMLATADGRMLGLVEEVNVAVKNAQVLLENVNRRIGPLLSDVRGLITVAKKSVNDIDGKIGPVMGTIQAVMKDARGAVARGKEALTGAKGIFAEGSPIRYELTKTLRELSSAARSIRVMADYLERHPEALIHGKGGRKRR
jgi:paraquat-inducible protein B